MRIRRHRRQILPLAVGIAVAWGGGAHAQDRPRIQLEDGTRIVMIGGGLAEGMRNHGFFETALHCGYPDLRLEIRNLGQSCLEVGSRAELANLDARLSQIGADVLFCFFGFNESFAGEAGIGAFQAELERFVDERQKHRYNGKSAPQLVLVSPVPYFQISASQPDQEAFNANLRLYADAIRAISRRKKVVYLDVLAALETASDETPRAISDDGIHPNEFGYWLLSRIMANKLRLVVQSPGSDFESAQAVRWMVLTKNRVAGQVLLKASERSDAELAKAARLIWDADKPSMTSIWAMEPTGHARYEIGTRPLIFQESTLTRAAAARESMRVAPGLRIDLWASEEEAPLMNPIEMEFDHRGRLWVLCSKPGEEGYIVVVEDVDHDHFADRSTLFARDLVDPASFAVSGESVVVLENGALVRYEDPDHDGVAETREVVLDGVGGAGAAAEIGGLVWDPSGGLWFGQGRGARTQIETAFGPRIVEDGAAFRLDPRRIELEVMGKFDVDGAPEPVFDDWGQALFGGETASLHPLSGRPDPRGVFLQTRHYPEDLRGAYAHVEAGDFRGGRWYRSWPNGSGLQFASRGPNLLESDDPDFSPADIEIGPDGAAYLLDSNGRIWRIAAFGRREFWRENIAGVDTFRLFGRLREPEPGTRQQVRQELWSRTAGEVIPALDRWVSAIAPDDPDRQQLLTEALWLHRAFDRPNESLLASLTTVPEPRARAAAATVLGFWAPRLTEPLKLLQRLVEDPDPRVRLQALHAARGIGSPEAGGVALLATNYPMDPELKALFDSVTGELGKSNAAPESLRAKAAGTATADLVKEEPTAVIASVLLERADVPAENLLRAARVTAENRGQPLTRFLIDALSDRGSSGQLLRNVQQLLTSADPWSLYHAMTELTELVESTPDELAREGAYGCLMIASATNGTFDRLVESVVRRDDFHYETLLRATAHVAAHEGARTSMAARVRDELAKTEVPTSRMGRFIRVVAPRSSEFRFAELEVISQGKNVAKDRPAKQLTHPDAIAWWASNARAGCNGITLASKELPLAAGVASQRPLLGVAIGGPASANEDLWWEVDLGARGEPIEEIVFHPIARGTEAPWVRFEIRDARGQVVWRSSRPASQSKPIRVPVELAESRIAAATAAAKAMGEDFRNSLVETAEKASSIDERFNAMRALGRLGGAPDHLQIKELRIAISNELTLLPPNLTVDPKTPIELTIENRNELAHRLALLAPESKAEIGELILAIARGDTADEDGVPDSAKVLFASGVIETGQSTIFRFVAPPEPGGYPVLTTNPEAWEELAGTLTVKAPPEPEAKPEPE